jgi:hypothetical protein
MIHKPKIVCPFCERVLFTIESWQLRQTYRIHGSDCVQQVECECGAELEIIFAMPYLMINVKNFGNIWYGN